MDILITLTTDRNSENYGSMPLPQLKKKQVQISHMKTNLISMRRSLVLNTHLVNVIFIPTE